MASTQSSHTETKPPAQSRRATWLKRVRQLHLYLGIFFAPSIVFFALSGALQLFGLHESHPGKKYQPPAWIEKLASIHKDQTISEKHGPPPGTRDGPRPPEFSEANRPPEPERGDHNEDRAESKSTLALKWFFLAMAVGLIFTTFLGAYMAFAYNRSRILIWSLLLAGTAIPAVLIAMMA